MVQNQNIRVAVDDTLQEALEVGLGQRGADRVDGVPSQGLGRSNHRGLLRPTPCIVGGQVIGFAVHPVLCSKGRGKRRTRHICVEEVAETVGFTVFTSGVVRVGQTRHEDDTRVLTDLLHRDRHARGRTAGDHQCAFFIDKAFG